MPRRQSVGLRPQYQELKRLGDTGIDLSFLQDPAYLEAQRKVTEEPIRRGFSTAGRRGLAASLRAGQPVGAFLTGLAGEEAEAIGEVGARNFLSNRAFGADLAQRRFANRFSQLQFEEQVGGRGGVLASILGTAGDIAGLAGAIAFPPAAPVIAGAQAARTVGPSAAQSIRRSTPGPQYYRTGSSYLPRRTKRSEFELNY